MNLTYYEDQKLLRPYLDPHGLGRLQAVGASPKAFTLITRGNALEVKQLRTLFNSFAENLQVRGAEDRDKARTRSALRRAPKNARSS